MPSSSKFALTLAHSVLNALGVGVQFAVKVIGSHDAVHGKVQSFQALHE